MGLADKTLHQQEDCTREYGWRHLNKAVFFSRAHTEGRKELKIGSIAVGANNTLVFGARQGQQANGPWKPWKLNKKSTAAVHRPRKVVALTCTVVSSYHIPKTSVWGPILYIKYGKRSSTLILWTSVYTAQYVLILSNLDIKKNRFTVDLGAVQGLCCKPLGASIYPTLFSDCFSIVHVVSEDHRRPSSSKHKARGTMQEELDTMWRIWLRRTFPHQYPEINLKSHRASLLGRIQLEWGGKRPCKEDSVKAIGVNYKLL
jgi:hypothetical protein